MNDNRKSHLLRSGRAFIFRNVSKAARSAAKGSVEPVDIELRLKKFYGRQRRTRVAGGSTVEATDVHASGPRFKGSRAERRRTSKDAGNVKHADIFKGRHTRHEQLLLGCLDDIEVLQTLHHFAQRLSSSSVSTNLFEGFVHGMRVSSASEFS